jgi:Na+/phosphate symporter
MVAMGTSLADQAWGRESAVYRVTGVLTVVGGWFVTALVAVTVSAIFAAIIYYLKLPAILILLAVAILLIWRNYKLHFKRQKEADSIKAFSLKKVTSATEAVQTSFEHAGMFLQEVGSNLKNCFEGVSMEDRQMLKLTRAETSKIQKWANVIIANIFKTLFLLHKEEVESAQKYSRIVRSLQTIAERHRDVILRAYVHVENNHSGLLAVQKEELGQVRDKLIELIETASQMLLEEEKMDYRLVENQYEALREMIIRFDKHQVQRIQQGESKTRLSILFYGFLEDSRKIAKHIHNLMSLFRESFRLAAAE